MACGGGLDGPAPDIRVFEGEQGWALAVPKEPAEAGVPPRIWILGEFEERIPLRIEYRSIDPSGSDAQVGISLGTGASGRWTEFIGRQPALKAGQFELLLISDADGVLLVSGFLTVR